MLAVDMRRWEGMGLLHKILSERLSVSAKEPI